MPPVAGLGGFLKQIVEDTRALVADLRAMARRLSTRWQWTRLKSRQRVDNAASVLENVRRTAEAKTRMCSSCRALIPIGARICPECQAPPGRPVAVGAARVMENLLPGFVSANSLILTIIMLIYGLTHLVYGRLSSTGDPHVDYWRVALVALGSNSGDLVVGGEPWRLLTAVFLHANFLHLAMNCYALMTVGPLIEHVYGYRKFLLFFVGTGIAGSAISAWWHWPRMLGVGASGAIFGLIGVAAMWGWRRGGSLGRNIHGQMIQWAIYGLVMGIVLHADNAAHLGGLVAGALMGFVVDDRAPRRAIVARLWEGAAYLCVLLVVVSFVMVALRYQTTLDLIFSS